MSATTEESGKLRTENELLNGVTWSGGRKTEKIEECSIRHECI